MTTTNSTEQITRGPIDWTQTADRQGVVADEIARSLDLARTARDAAREYILAAGIGAATSARIHLDYARRVTLEASMRATSLAFAPTDCPPELTARFDANLERLHALHTAACDLAEGIEEDRRRFGLS